MAKKKNPAAVALGRLGGSVPGRKGFAILTEGERKAAAVRGALARWGSKKAGKRTNA